MAYKFEKPNPDRTYLECRNVAGCQLQDRFRESSGTNSDFVEFRWIKNELSWPSFDDLTFAYKNQIFSVLIAYCQAGAQNSKTGNIQLDFTFPLGRDRAILDACEKNNLIPCAFPIYPARRQPLLPFNWNLINIKTGEHINPLEIGTDALTEISEWELMNWGVSIVKEYLRKEGREIGSFCDILGVNPQIWFIDTDGKPAWVSVAPTKYPNTAQFDNSIIQPQIEKFRGYFAPLSLCNSQDVGRKIYRGEGVYVSFKGLEKVHDVTKQRRFFGLFS